MSRERIALYPGSFDPLTNGHLDILERSLLVFDRVVLAVGENSTKIPLFSVEERMELIRASLPESCKETVEVATFSGLTVSYAREIGATAIVRGLRVVSDFENEFQIALMNRRLDPTVHTMFFMTSFANVFVSSSIIREICRNGGNVDTLIPHPCARAMEAKFADYRRGKENPNG